jgi:hypothetical protein
MSLAPGRTYRYFRGEPLYPFGWGLSYTTFVMTWQGQSHSAVDLGNNADSTLPQTYSYSINVTNTGSRVGDEVVFAFFSTTAIPSDQPASALIKQLFNFERLTLEPGQTGVVTFTVTPTTDFLTYDVNGNQVSYPGLYEVQFTNGVDQVLSASINVVGSTVIIDTFV